METIMLKTENLTKTYHQQEAVSKLNIEIEKNCIYGLLGANGAGKSTTLKMIAGMIKPTKGQIIYKNHPFKRSDLNEIGTLIESPPLYGHLTAEENLLVRTTSLGLPKSRIKEVLNIVHLCYSGKKKTRQFSMGMKQRLGIALALVNHPKLLILDEPTNGLDPIGIKEFRKLIRSFPDKGITVILSSHILSEIEQTVDKIGIISNGHLGYQGKLPKNTHELEALFLKVAETYSEFGGVSHESFN